MTKQIDLSCGCGPLPHPPPPLIPAGLSELTLRQWAGFPEYRGALLSAIRTQEALARWRARGAGDLGVMLLEAWSYVLDITGFYDARIAERAFLGTAPDQASARRLTALLGHRPRPAMAARVKLALEADGFDPVTLPIGTAFRSDPFDDEPPHVFELRKRTVIWPQRNRWELAPVREDTFDGVLRFQIGQGPHVGAVLIIWSADGTDAAARVTSVETETAVDGFRYLRVHLDPPSAFNDLIGQKLSDLSTAIARLPVARSPFQEVDSPPNGSFAQTKAAAPSSGGSQQVEAVGPTIASTIVLDALYSQIRPGDRAAVELGSVLIPVTIDSVVQTKVNVDDANKDATAAATKVTFSPPVLPIILGPTTAFTLHVNPLVIGSPTRPAKTSLSLPDFGSALHLVPPVQDLRDSPTGGETILKGAENRGALLLGQVIEEGDGEARFAPDEEVSVGQALSSPLELLGNVVEVVRGETVIDELLGVGNAAEAFLSFSLGHQPLTWVEDASLPSGRRPELVVRVDNIEWSRVETFFGYGPEDRIYVVRQNEEGAANIVFGDGDRGERPASGAEIRSDYRFGAGAAKPPPGSINQIAVPIPGLATVSGPIPATGGADAETAEQLRSEAPKGTLTLGRAVSIPDFEALARSFPGVVNATAGWSWDGRRQRAVVMIWIIADGGDPADELENWLAGRVAKGQKTTVRLAMPAAVSALAVTLEVAQRHRPDVVRQAARQALFGTATGILSPARIPIGKPLFRSMLTHRLHEVPGVASVPSILLDDAPMPHAIAPGLGRWFDLEDGAIVS